RHVSSVPVSIDNPSSVDTVVSITTVDNSATDPIDYSSTTVTATIPNGQTTVNVSIPITDDTTGEPTEDFTVNGTVTSGNTTNPSDSGTVTITDNDTPGMSLGDVTIAEDGGSASVPVSIDNPSSVDTVVSITTVDNSATNPNDYSSTTVTATIPNGQTTVNVSIPITDDTTGEPTEDFTVNGAVTSGNTTNPSDSGTVTITDNETPTMSVGDVTIAEDGGSASVPVSIDNPSSVDTVVSITTVDNSATNPNDYSSTTVTATIPNGQTTVNVSIPITDDTTGEPTEDFTVNGTVTIGNTTNPSDSGTVTITDNDTPGMGVGDVTIAEDGGSASVPVSIDNPSSVDTVVSITTVDNSATNPNDYSSTTVTATIPAGHTVVNVFIPITDDTTVEPTENFTVTGTVAIGNTSNPSDSGIITILDNDVLPIIVSAKIYLQGAFLNPNTGEENLMRDDLRVANFLPTTSPYTDVLTCDSSVFNTTGTNAVVDWVFIELRAGTTNTTIVASQSALLLRNGDIVAADGFSNLEFEQPVGDYFISINHRNHLGIMSASIVSLSSDITSVDFTDANNQISYGTNAQTTVGMPVNRVGLWAGDVNTDKTVQYIGATPDLPSILSHVLNDPGNVLNFPTFMVSGYNNNDVNMNGETQYSGATPETPFILQNVLSHSGNLLNLSTYPIEEQLPEN
ncbi:Calx-beta domain-containing protein, partial [Lacinutrix jangbogonensis]|uniref:Calx-beta domain-containing protein n=1 Tax=Lacinutrix jangbogonensis TaxID=1469557 RepID=UPI000689DF1B